MNLQISWVHVSRNMWFHHDGYIIKKEALKLDFSGPDGTAETVLRIFSIIWAAGHSIVRPVNLT